MNLRIFTFRKWASFTGLGFLSLVPFVIVYSLLAISAFYLSGLYLSLSFFIIFSQKNIQKRLLNRRLSVMKRETIQEKEIAELVETLARRANVRVPLVRMKKKRERLYLGMSCRGWPYKNQIKISQEIIEIYQKGLSSHALEAWLAHEISHLQYNDPFIDFFACLFQALIRYTTFFGMLFIASGLVITLNIAWLAAIAILPIVLLIAELAYALFSRAKETLADLHAAQLINNPKKVAEWVYEKYVQYMDLGILATEDPNGAEIRETLSPSDQVLLKNAYQNYIQLPRKQAYQNLKRLMENIEEVPHAGYLAFFTSRINRVKKSIAQGLSTHPNCESREAVIKSNFQNVFR